MRRLRGSATVRRLLIALMTGLLLWGGSERRASAAETAWSIARLVSAKKDWPILTNTPLRVEGRIASHLRGQLRFQNCDLSFILTPELERKLVQAKNVEVAGELVRSNGRLVFEVADLKPLPTDIEQFRSREAALRNPQPGDWYTLADWAVTRGDFYNDEDLRDAAATCRVRGVALELLHLKPDDAQGRFALADKARGFGLPQKLVGEIRHEAYRTWWFQASPGSNPKGDVLKALEEQMRQEWPDAFEPISAFPTDLSRRYAENPSDTYREANDAQRQTLRRLFAADIQLKRLELQMSPDGENGDEIADQMEQLVPERKSLAMAYRDKALMYRLGEIGDASKAEALDLANTFRTRQKATKATETLLRWIVAKEQRLQPKTAPEFIDLADDYLALLKDEERAVSLLLEAYRLEPQSTDVLNRFRQLGYEYNGITWIKPKEPRLPSADPNQPTTPTQLAAGMSAGQLIRMLGEPTTRTRLATSAGVDEFWIYGRPGEGSRLVIELRRPAADGAYAVTRYYHR